MAETSTSTPLKDRLSNYYRFQSKIYDATRWSFLFGRKSLINNLPFSAKQKIKVLEVGCGTGANLHRLANTYERATIHGIDLSADMLSLARKKTAPFGDRVHLYQGHYGQIPVDYPYDLIIFSYCLTMVNPGWEDLIRVALSDLRAGGILGVVDFHHTPVRPFEKHMSGHHVRMDGHLAPHLLELLPGGQSTVRPAYGGLWHYFQFIGQKP
jgi:S-adenosylmethionine-diacylgycerolhomoserine-N-methlytransferase